MFLWEGVKEEEITGLASHFEIHVRQLTITFCAPDL